MRVYRDVLDPASEIGIDAHENLSLSVANSMIAVEEGVIRVDASLGGSGRRCRQLSDRTLRCGRRPQRLEARLRRVRIAGCCRGPRPPAAGSARCDRETLTLGVRRGLWILPPAAETASERYGVDVRTILVDVGKRGLVEGQEDMIHRRRTRIGRRRCCVGPRRHLTSQPICDIAKRARRCPVAVANLSVFRRER
jgi:4-hydroxy 2-oxovalerate aldolase